ncbi:hypothetical protein C9F10_13275, partial [Salmonella enterica subsp. enterica serovar Poona]
MAVQKRLIKGALACAFALMLSGGVPIPDAIKGSRPAPREAWGRGVEGAQRSVGPAARWGGA